MGMITRVRGRLRSLHTIQKLDPEVRDEKIAETVCLLSVLFLLPYCSRGHAPLLVSLGGWCVASYSFLVLPLLISANYKYPVKWMRKLFAKTPGLLKLISRPFVVVISRFLQGLHVVEQFYLKMYNVYAMISQMFFFVLCSLLFNEPSEINKEEDYVLIALKTLLFYSVFTYFATKTKDIMFAERVFIFRNWSMLEGICRIVLEWAKAIIVVVCLREQGIYFKPTLPYAALTSTYYICTEKLFTNCIQKLFAYCTFAIFDDLEHLYVPLLLNTFATAMGISVQLYYLVLDSTKFINFTIVCSYFTIYLRTKDSYINYWKIIKMEKETFDNFRNATRKELEDYDDICAVCLNKMSAAKITPCNHFFHPNCLKQCLKTSFFCPLCKFDF